jgi:hypothetical protein
MKNPSGAANPASRLGDLAGIARRAAVFPSHDDQFWAAPRSITNVRRNCAQSVNSSYELICPGMLEPFPQAQAFPVENELGWIRFVLEQ